MSVMTIPTLLDPRFKNVCFCSPENAQAAEKCLTAECAVVIWRFVDTVVEPSTSNAF